MPSTQEFLAVQDVKEDVVLLKDGSIAMILQTSAVNFDLLSQTEQLAIIGAFAGLLNSLSFSIQILIRSKRLDISNYLNILKDAEGKQTNPLLKTMMAHYRQFVGTVISENEVLDKQFFVVISVSALELGVMRSQQDLQKGLTILTPRRDHILRQLGRIGLKSSQLDNERLIKLFYDIYNDTFKSSFDSLSPDVKPEPASQTQPAAGASIPAQPSQKLTPSRPTGAAINNSIPQSTPQSMPNANPVPVATPQLQAAPTAPQQAAPMQQRPAPIQNTTAPAAASAFQTPGNQQNSGASRGRVPFVVEELPDDYGVR